MSLVTWNDFQDETLWIIPSVEEAVWRVVSRSDTTPNRSDPEGEYTLLLQPEPRPDDPDAIEPDHEAWEPHPNHPAMWGAPLEALTTERLVRVVSTSDWNESLVDDNTLHEQSSATTGWSSATFEVCREGGKSESQEGLITGIWGIFSEDLDEYYRLIHLPSGRRVMTSYTRRPLKRYAGRISQLFDNSGRYIQDFEHYKLMRLQFKYLHDHAEPTGYRLSGRLRSIVFD